MLRFQLLKNNLLLKFLMSNMNNLISTLAISTFYCLLVTRFTFYLVKNHVVLYVLLKKISFPIIYTWLPQSQNSGFVRNFKGLNRKKHFFAGHNEN